MTEKSPYNKWINSLSDEELIAFAQKLGQRSLITNRKSLLSLLTKGSSSLNAKGRALFSKGIYADQTRQDGGSDG